MARARRRSPVPLHYEFPYVRFHGKFYPLIPLTLTLGRYSVNTFALLDSGASISVFRPEISKALHVPRRLPDNMRLGTANGGVQIGISRVTMGIESSSFPVNVGFSNTFATAFNILGREGFFRRFSICFNEMLRTVIMVPLDKL